MMKLLIPIGLGLLLGFLIPIHSAPAPSDYAQGYAAGHHDAVMECRP